MANLIQYYDIFKDITQKNTYTPIFEEKMVMFINEEYQNLPLHGWKIHISSTVENSLEIFYICAKYLTNKNINFKCLKNSDLLKEINDKNCSRSNFGKFITVYPIDSKQAEKILEELSELLEKYDSPYILNDLRYKNCKSLYFRYGRMRFIYGESEDEKKQIRLKNGKVIADPRLPYFYLPEEIEWPFKFKVENDNDNDDDKLLLHEKYEVIKAISMSSKGGIYLAKYKNKEFIIKEYRPNVYVINNFTGEYTYNNEKNVYEKLTEYNFTPKLYDSFKEWEHFYLVLEKVNGETLTNYLAQNMKIYHYENSRRNYIKIVKDILLQIASIIEVLHDIDYVLGDISSENFLIDENNKVYAIDFESCYKIYNTENNYIGTKGFFHPEVKHKVTGKQKDIVGFGFLAMKLFSNSNF
ncbi:TPA: protein kinase family protein, partial [Staphylococcus pseudintermedius]|nr:protein kinase family protein [Staphylococcus pseudintermedius]